MPRSGGLGVTSDPFRLPESLLVPVLDTAGEMLRSLDADAIPTSLRPLAGFDRRGLSRGVARTQLQRALDLDPSFRHRAVESFLARPEVVTALAAWSPEKAHACVDDAAQRDDLALLASALWAARPDGFEFGLGLACAATERRREDQTRDEDERATAARLEAFEEARRRSDEAVELLTAERARLEDDLRAERGGRRGREDHARREMEQSERRATEAETARAQAEDAVTAARAHAARADEARNAVQRELETLRHASRSPSAALPALSERDLDALSDAAVASRRLASSIDEIVGRLRRDRPAPEVAARPAANGDRVRPAVPPGLVADTAEGLGATLSGGRVALIVDGYNVTMRGWAAASKTDQRERLIQALSGLHARTKCPITVVFDGADVGAPPPGRRPGVHVRFSDVDEEADAVVVRAVASLPTSQAVVVASSDRWVQDHARAAGAEVVSSDSLLGALRA